MSVETLFQAIHKDLCIKEDIAINTYILIHNSIENNMLNESDTATLKDMRDDIKPPESFIEVKNFDLQNVKTERLEELIKKLNSLIDSIQDEQIRKHLTTLKAFYDSFLQKLNNSTLEERSILFKRQDRICIFGDNRFYCQENSEASLLSSETTGNVVQKINIVYYKILNLLFI
jgi:flagellin-specific chaperone FliS